VVSSVLSEEYKEAVVDFLSIRVSQEGDDTVAFRKDRGGFHEKVQEGENDVNSSSVVKIAFIEAEVDPILYSGCSFDKLSLEMD
jgi:hypothetical protein